MTTTNAFMGDTDCLSEPYRDSAGCSFILYWCQENLLPVSTIVSIRLYKVRQS